MKRISTPYSSSFKIFPVMFIGFVAVYLILALMGGALKTEPMLLVVPCFMAVVGYLSWKAQVQDLADSVDDGGDFLLVKKGGLEDTVPLSHIANVNFSTDARGAMGRITLTLSPPGKFGTEIMFAPPPQLYFGPYPRNEIAEDLVTRCEAARLKKSA